jgi:CheY-like chemotaxis protein
VSHTLLLADDSVTIQRVIELTFADEDIKVVAVSDGDQAIARLDSAPPDIVLADIGMPGKSGYEVAQYIKKSPRLSKIPVVLLTGAFEPVDQARAAEAGCDGILAKPFEPQLVITRVKELLGTGPAPVKSDNGAQEAAKAAAAVAAAPAAQPASSRNTSDYFDRLDAAFTSKEAAPPAALVAGSKLPKHGARTAAPQEPMDLPIAQQPKQQPPADLPLAAAPQPATKPPNPAPAAVAAPEDPVTGAITVAVPRVAVAPPNPTPMPTEPMPIPAIADAFAALLAAEQAEPLPPSVPAWPASGPPMDLIAEQVTRRVLEQMSDKVVRETVTTLVSQIAERLVREEIEKIKATIK